MALNKCAGCGRAITENQQYLTKHGVLFHENCLEIFLASAMGQEWNEKNLRSRTGQENQINELVGSMKNVAMCRDYKEYANIKDDLMSTIAEEGDDKAYCVFQEKLSEYKNRLKVFIRDENRKEMEVREKEAEARRKAREVQLEGQRRKEEKRKHREEISQQFSQKYSRTEEIIKKTLFYDNDKEQIQLFLKSIYNNANEQNIAKLKRINALDFCSASPMPKNGLIIWGIILIITVFLSPLGIILLIVGIAKKVKAKKALIEAAEYNFNLVKEIISSTTSKNPASQSISVNENEATKSLAEQIKEIYIKTIERNVDSADLKRIVFAEGHGKELAQAKEAFHVASDEEIFLLYDDTVRHSFKQGFVLTDKNLYFTNEKTNANTSLKISEVGNIAFKKGMLTSTITFNEFSVSTGAAFAETATRMTELLKKSVEIVRNKKLVEKITEEEK